MDGYAYSVATIRTMESKVLFKVKQSDLSHWGMGKLFSGKVSDFLASFPKKKIGFCLDLCEGKSVLRIG